MGSKSQYLEQAVLNILNGQTITPPATWYLAYFTAAPTATTAGTECTGGGYVRQAITANSTNFPVASGGGPATAANGVTFTGSAATGSGWSGGSSVVAWALMDASTGGNMWWWGSVTTSKPILAGDTPVVPTGDLTFSDT